VSDDKSQAVPEGSADVDALVARYAPIGRNLRRRRKLTRIALALLVPALGIAAILLWQSRDLIASKVTIEGEGEGDADRIERALAEFQDLKASLKAETGAVAAQRAELDRQQKLFSRHNDELVAQLAAVEVQRSTLAEQARKFEEQRGTLATAIAKTDEQRRKLQASAGSQSAIDRQMLEIDRQKRALEEQQRRFLDQGQALADELGEINRQRTDIEKQRRAIEEQQAEVRKLLEQIEPAGANRSSGVRDEAPSNAAGIPDNQLLTDEASPDVMAGGAIAQMAAVAPAVLSTMRGGVDTGHDYSFAIGITRTTSINGIEQFSSAMYVNELGNVTGTGTPTHTLQLGEPLIVQTGPGNFVDAATLSNMNLSNSTIIQNTLDNQTITNQMVLDVSLQNVSSLIQGMDLSRLARDGLNLPR
jgi:hypothetical protein